MSTLGPSQYHPEIQTGEISSMDVTPIIHQHPSELSSTFIPTITSNSHPPPVLPSQSMQEASPVFTDRADPANVVPPPMHAPMLEMTSAAFMNSMEVLVPTSQMRADPPGFLSDLPSGETFSMAPPLEDTMNLEMLASTHSLSVSPPQSQIPSPAIHGTASSYSVGVTSSLESALDQPGVSIMRNRASASVSPTTIPPSFLNMNPPAQQVPNITFPPVEGIVGKQEEAQPLDVDLQVVDMLSDIIQTTNSVMHSYMAQHNFEATSKLHELEERVSQVTQMFKVMMPATAQAQNAPYSPPPPPPPSTVPIIEEQQQPISFPPSAMEFSPVSMDVSEEHLNVSDQSRKRCASELEEPRTAKAPKMEPQDDVLLALPLTETAQDTDVSGFQSIGISLPLTPTQLPSHSQSRPSSRPPTPPVKFSSRSSLGSLQQPPMSSIYSSFVTNKTDFSISPPTAVPTTSPSFPGIHTSWSDPIVPTRHHSSLSAGSLVGSVIPLTVASSGVAGNMMDNFSTPPLPQVPLPPPVSHTAPTTISPLIGRMSRSGSINGTFPNAYGFGYIEPFSEPAGPWSSGISRVSGKMPNSHSAQTWFIGSEGSVPSAPPSVSSDAAPSKTLSTAPTTTRNSPTEDEDEDEDDDDDNDSSFSKSVNYSSADSPAGTSNTGSDVPQEYRADVDRIFFEYLNKICSNLDATDSKGEPIHQTLMAKKMQRLDESPDFRPFKFRIQAFTLAFLDELAAQGFPEEKIPMKKIRNYLWRQQYILRFNEDGKKAKSKGNHIWNIEAKKAGDGKWEFRPFHRKLAGSPPTVAYCGLKWSWTPRVWDPQASWQNIPVEYSSPSLPSWLSWKDDVLSGTPPPNAESCRIITNAKYTLDGQEGVLTHSFNLTIAPMTSIDTNSFTRSRRPSLAGDPPRRSTSDSVLFQAVQRAKPRPQSVDAESPDTRVIRVLQSVAQRVTEEAASQFVSASPPKQSDLQDLAKQKHVLEQTVEAYDKAISGSNPVQSRRLAVAAQNVVVQAAHTVIADRTIASGGIPIQQSETSAIKSVTVTELSDATQDAIAQAVKREGTGSTEVDIIVAATSILKSRTPGVPTTVTDPTQTIVQQSRSLSANAVPRLLPGLNSYPSNLPPLTEYA